MARKIVDGKTLISEGACLSEGACCVRASGQKNHTLQVQVVTPVASHDFGRPHKDAGNFRTMDAASAKNGQNQLKNNSRFHAVEERGLRRPKGDNMRSSCSRILKVSPSLQQFGCLDKRHCICNHDLIVEEAESGMIHWNFDFVPANGSGQIERKFGRICCLDARTMLDARARIYLRLRWR